MIMRGMTTCDVCNRYFALTAGNHYISRAEGKTGFAAIAGSSEPDLHDAIDCPHCGCQKLLQKRERVYVPIATTCEEEEEENNE